MNENDTGPCDLGMEPEDLDGHTIEELSDYLDAGRMPANPSIDQSPGCQIALASLTRLRLLTNELIASDAAAESVPEDSWVQGVIASIALDARAGRRIPIITAEPKADLGITEGAVRGIIRSAEWVVPGVVIGKCWFEGDVTVPEEPIRIGIDASVPYGESIPGLAEQLRAEISALLATHTTLNIVGIDIAIYDVQQMPTTTEEN